MPKGSARFAAALLCIAAMPAWAQDGGAAAVSSASPFFVPDVSNEEAASVQMPDLVYTAEPGDAADYDKYYYFHRPDTDFATAYRDLTECDGYARGLTSGLSPSYGQGVLGDALANAIGDAIYGSANRRKLRRTNMRTCMHFKGYARYGLSKPVWQAFNFEEGNSSVGESDRVQFLKQQARAASSATPEGKALGL